MKTVILAAILLTGIVHQSFAQATRTGVYMPLEFQKAYETNTRKPDGSVSASYWQNRSTYNIKARIDPLKKILYGEATIVYQNNSPDTLRLLVFHTYHDYYRSGSARQGFFSSGDYLVTEGVILDTLLVNHERVSLANADSLRRQGTFYDIILKKPLPPKASAEVQVGWHYTIPGKGFERSGAIDSTSMLIGYWYPEMAVYDDIDGWDRIVYDAATEFYHDYSNYEVEIEAPDNFMVWASVAPVNEAEVYPAQLRERLANARKSTEPVQVFTKADFKPSSTGTRKWKYSAKHFPDFTFALSDHFVWDACMYKDAMGEYFISTAYPEEHPSFKAVLKTIGESIRVFHTGFPAYMFPYKHFTVFNGLLGGGMEFPGMANDVEVSGADYEKYTGTKTSDFDANLGLTMHEMCHMYFPFMMGINEKKYAWMDEGMASFTSWFLPKPFEGDYDQPYLGSQQIAPVMVPSYIASNSGVNSYGVASYSYFSLYRLLGKDLFKKCLKTYMDTWQHKHPTPYDFMFIFNNTSGIDLNWFWRKWYFDWGYMDLGLKSFKDNVLTVVNEGGRPLAFNIKINYSDKTSSLREVNPAVWKDKSIYTVKMEAKKAITSFELKIPTNGDALNDNNILMIKN